MPRPVVFRVYLCSVFSDTAPERAYLYKIVVPALKRSCGPAGVTVEWLDPHLQVRSEKEAEAPAALERALGAADSCSVFLALVGGRLGPLLTAVPSAARRDPGVRSWLDHAGPRSRLELEIRHGLRRDAPARGHQFFYFRDPAFLEDVPAEQRRAFVEERPDCAERLDDLKDLLRGSVRQAIRSYTCRWDPARANGTDLKAFGQAVLKDLTQALRVVAGVEVRDESLTDGSDDYEFSIGRGDVGGVQADEGPTTGVGLPRPALPPAAVPAAPQAPRYVDENVQFTVYRPRVVQPGRWYPLLAFAHLSERRPDAPADEPDPVEEVYRQAQHFLGEQARQYQDVTQDSRLAVPREGEITLVPEVPDEPGVEFNPPRRSFLWQEDVHREEFRLRAAAALDGRTVRGRLTVFLGGLILAEVTLVLRVDGGNQQAGKYHMEPEAARRYRKIFASYSHRDTAVVLMVERFMRTMGDEYLRDGTHLRAGEVWDDGLLRLIDKADVFQLFWSHNAMHSPFVRREWEHALSLNRSNFVRPTYWEEPLPCTADNSLPPKTLRRLHFQRLALEGTPAPPPTVVMPMASAMPVAPAPAPPPRAHYEEYGDADLDSAACEYEEAPPPRRRPPARARQRRGPPPHRAQGTSGLGLAFALLAALLGIGLLGFWLFSLLTE